MKIYILLLLLTLPHFAVAQRSILPAELYPFYHGVASGDPTSSSVIIWTRPTPEATYVPGDDIAVEWRVATDTGMTNVVAAGVTYTSDARDFTVKVDVTGLSAGTCYYYDFRTGGHFSVRGRTFTMPSGNVSEFRMAVVSCSNYEHGYFNAYRALLNRNDFQCVLHLGDYIYEYAQGGYSASISGRENEPVNEIISLSDYRTRYSHYRLDDDLRDLHQQYPFITVWDDHESANDAYKDGAENHTPGTEGNWSDRKNNAVQAYHEWLPMRDAPGGSPHIYRKFEIGNLITLNMLDTRLEGRSEQVSASSSDVDDPARTLLGSVQYDWLINNLTNSTTTWNLAGQQVMMAPLEVFGIPVNADQWDGYNYERNRLYNDLLINGIQNFVVLTGDIHTSWANDLPLGNYDSGTGSGSAGVEFVVTSVTSPGFPIGFGASIIQAANGHIRWLDLTQHGYLILHTEPGFIQGEWYFMDDISTPGSTETLGTAYKCTSGAAHLEPASLITQISIPLCTLAPALPMSSTTNVENTNQPAITGVYPNPFENEILIQFFSSNQEMTNIALYSISGQKLMHLPFTAAKGVNYMKLHLEDLPAGIYTLELSTGDARVTRKIVKK